MNNREFGNKGEDLACEYLIKNGYEILERNKHFSKLCEIDIIAKFKNKVVFVEVKTRREGSLVSGAAAVDKKKLERTFNAASIFMKRLKSPLDMRIDVAEVTVSFDDNGDKWQLNYIENVG